MGTGGGIASWSVLSLASLQGRPVNGATLVVAAERDRPTLSLIVDRAGAGQRKIAARDARIAANPLSPIR